MREINKVFLAHFPLHNYDVLKKIEDTMLRMMVPWNSKVPLDDIKDYFGERIGLYFAYLQVWSIVFMSGWQQRQATLAMKWGAAGFEKEQKIRPQFQGIETTSPIDVVGLVFLESYISDYSMAAVFSLEKKSFSAYVTATVLVVCITVVGDAFFAVATYLNDFENHRTDTEYEDSLILKVSVFYILNSYTYLTFIAFVKPVLGYKCVMGSCYEELSNTLLILLSYSLFAGVLKEIIIRSVMQYYNYKSEASSIEPGKKLGAVEEQFILAEYRALEGTFQEYAAIVVRIDCWKLCTVFRRPIPLNAEDIGVWEDALNAVSILGVVYNFGLIFLSAHYLLNTPWNSRWIYFMCSEIFMFLVIFFISISVARVPSTVQMQLDRQTFLVEKVIGNAEDEVEEEFVVESDRTFTINIAVTDNDWERPIDEDESNLGGDGPDDEEGKEGGREGGGDYEGKRVATGPSVRKAG
eukprot:gene24443-32892_t